MKKINKLPFDLQYFAENPPPSGDQQTDQTDQSGGQQQEPSGQQEEPPKSFTQDDVNNISAKEAKKAQEKLLKQLGIDNFDTAKDGMAKFKEWQESQKTEQEKQTERLQELEKGNTSLTDENATLKAQMSAMKAGVKADSVEDVVVLAQRLVNDDTDMDAAIKQVIERYPHFGADEQKEEGPPKPSFSNGQHQKQEQTEAEKWASAFGIKQQ
ncbi:hypothetical protein [Shouchella hunanensis]|uniref:Phage protein n=1 Tax=Shouchella hunanensis TaxID=766894 RepID=A0ABY7W3F0_9BACI|nr:hypothetical protein [Shouchella hunanensis]WDF02949.1 hypothetical protein PQ477_15795 [Shouchella hunanensis]